MTIRAKLFDGTILEFPDGTSPDVISKAARQQTQTRVTQRDTRIDTFFKNNPGPSAEDRQQSDQRFDQVIKGAAPILGNTGLQSAINTQARDATLSPTELAIERNTRRAEGRQIDTAFQEAVDADAKKQPKYQAFGKAFLAGIDDTQKMLYAGAEAVGEVTGGRSGTAAGDASFADILANAGKEGRERNTSEANNYGPRAGISDVRSVGDAFAWAAQTAGNLIPMAVPAAVGGAIGAGAAPAAAVTATVGGALGAFVPSLALGVGEVQSSAKDKDPTKTANGWTFAGGTAIAALDSILPGQVAGKLVARFGYDAATEIALRTLLRPASTSMVKAVGKEALKKSALEGLTESFQGAIGEVTASLASESKIDWNALPKQMIEEGAAGALMGGGVGVVTGVSDANMAKEQDRVYRANVDATAIARQQPINPNSIAAPFLQRRADRLPATGNIEAALKEAGDLTEDDINSPLPDDKIAAGRARIVQNKAATVVDNRLKQVGLPELKSTIEIADVDGNAVTGTIEDVFDTDGGGFKMKLADGTTLDYFLDDINDAGDTIRKVPTTAAEIDAELSARADAAMADISRRAQEAALNPTEPAPTAIGTDTPPPSFANDQSAVAGFMARTRRVESAGKDGAKNPRSSATGRYQFIESTFKQTYQQVYGGSPERAASAWASNRNDPAIQEALMLRLTSDNAASLKRAGIAVTEGNLYLAHFAGAGGARALHTNPSASAEAVLGADAVEANPFLKGKTAAEVIAWAASKMGGPATGSTIDTDQEIDPFQDILDRRKADRAERDAAAPETTPLIPIAKRPDAIQFPEDTAPTENVTAPATSPVQLSVDGEQQLAGGAAAAPTITASGISDTNISLGDRPLDGKQKAAFDNMIAALPPTTSLADVNLVIQEFVAREAAKNPPASGASSQTSIIINGVRTDTQQTPPPIFTQAEFEAAQIAAQPIDAMSATQVSPTQQPASSAVEAQAITPATEAFQSSFDTNPVAALSALPEAQLKEIGTRLGVRRIGPGGLAGFVERIAAIAPVDLRPVASQVVAATSQRTSSTGLVEMGGGMASGVSAGLIDMYVKRASAGETTNAAGAADPILQVARRVREQRGGVELDRTTVEGIAREVDAVQSKGMERQQALKQIVQKYGIPDAAPTAAPQGNMTPEQLGRDDARRNYKGKAPASFTPEQRAEWQNGYLSGQKVRVRGTGNKPKRRGGGFGTFLEYLADIGGVRDDEGNNLAGMRGLQQGIAGAGSLIRANGLSIDQIGERAFEDGWFTERPTTTEVLELLDKAQFQKVYNPLEDGDRRQEDGVKQQDILTEKLQATAADIGVTLNEAELRYAASKIAGGDTTEDAVMSAVEWGAAQDLPAILAAAPDEAYDIPYVESRTNEPAREIDRSLPEGGERPAPNAGNAPESTTASDEPTGDSRPEVSTAPIDEALFGDTNQPNGQMTERQRAELDARQKQGMARRGSQEGLSDQGGGLFSAERDQTSLFGGEVDPVERKKTDPLSKSVFSGNLDQADIFSTGQASAQSVQEARDHIQSKLFRFASGMSAPKDLVAGSYAIGGSDKLGIGVDIGEMSAPSIKKMADAIVGLDVRAFIDSGAFSLFKQGLKQDGEVLPLDFDKIMKRYEAVQDAIAEADPAEKFTEARPGTVLFVMPDIVGDQAGSLELLSTYKADIGQFLYGGSIRAIVPLQKGELSLSQAYNVAVNALGTDNFIVGIPANEAAISPEEMREFVRISKPEGLHFLGAISPKKLGPKMDALAEALAESDHRLTHLSADANLLRSRLFGQKSGDRNTTVQGVIGDADRALGSRNARYDEVAPADAKIEDFGERLEGARKFYAEAFKDKVKDAEKLDIASEPLSKSWPEPDYQKLIEGGADPYAVASMRAMRDTIPSRPRRYLNSWVQQVEALRGLAFDMLENNGVSETFESKLKGDFKRSLRDLQGSIDLYMEFGHERSFKGMSFREDFYTLYRGQENVTKWSISKKAKSTAFSNWPTELAVGDSRQEVVDKFRALLTGGGLDANNNKTKSERIRFDIYSYRGKPGFYIGKKIGKDTVDLRQFDDVKSARAFKVSEEGYAELVAELEKLKNIPPERKEVNSPRIGVNHRGGADVTTQQFGETFGFRGVQFGNYVEGPRRQTDMNQAYDALMDMAGVLGIDPKAISLNGKLGLAFGARGKGGKGAAAAHYETGNVVINLTKNAGAGSLAHEWWHSLDNYFGMKRNAGSYITDSVSRDILGDMRPEMLGAFRAVMSAIRSTALKQRSKELDKVRTKDYWSTDIEMSARSFESYVIAKLQDEQFSNDYLANIVPERAFDRESGYPYPTAAEIDTIRAGFDAFFQTVQTRETETGVELYSRVEAPAQVDTPAFKRWFGDSKVVDADGEPLVVYHGSQTKGLNSFDTSLVTTRGQGDQAGTYFSSNPMNASNYTRPPIGQRVQGSKERGQVYAAYLSLQNPLNITQDIAKFRKQGMSFSDAKREAMKKLDRTVNDGIVFDGDTANDGEFVAFNPSQIKSATGNNGDFDIESPDIRYSRVEEATDAPVDAPVEVGAETGVELTNSLAAVKALVRNNRFAKGRDLKVLLQQRALAAQKASGISLKGMDDATAQRLADFVVADALEALKNNANAIGWYDRAVKTAKRELARLYPEIATDPESEFAFIWALAVTSNGLKVNKNFELAAQAYEGYKATGKFPVDIGIGEAAKAINSGLRLYDGLIKKFGSWQAVRDFMVREQTVKDIIKMSGIKVSGESMNETVRGAIILGPKIGNGFFSNLYGYFDSLTMDRWQIRTVGRWRGTLIKLNPVMERQKREEIKALMVRLTTADRAELRKLFEGSDVKLSPVMSKQQINDLADEVAKRSMKPVWRNEINTLTGGETLRLAGNALAKYLDGQVEAPTGGIERTFLRKVFQIGLDNLRNKNGLQGLTMADLQALLWYPEKLVYESAKKPAGKEVTSYADDDAPDYGNAARNLVRDRLGLAGRDSTRPSATGPRPSNTGVSPQRTANTDRLSSTEARERRGSVGPRAQQIDALRASLDAQLKKMGLADKVRLRLVDGMVAAKGAQGRFIPTKDGLPIIEIALDAVNDQSFVLRHEVIHALREIGAISPTDWMVLSAAAKRNEKIWSSVKRRYSDMSQEIMEEEAVADLFGYHQSAKIKPSGAFGKALAKIGDILRAIRSGFQGQGFKTPRDVAAIFDDFESGRTVANASRKGGPTQGMPRDMVAYHGSPKSKRYDRFSTDFMGTGEGAQAYGWGLYFAESKNIAEFYRKGLSQKALINLAREAYDADYSIDDAYAEMLENPDLSDANKELLAALEADDWFGFDYPHQAIQAAFKDIENFDPSQRTLNAVKDQGQLYRVDIPDDGAYLLWDKPLNEQPLAIQKAIAGLSDRVRPLDATEAANVTGASLYRRISNAEAAALRERVRNGEYVDNTTDNADRAASKALQDLGIAGIKYLDGSSRSAGDGSYNYVVFDDAAVSILAMESRVEKTININGGPRPTTNSNGQPLAGTEEGLRNFWNWFGDSTFVDRYGQPLVFYHGTRNAGFKEFVPAMHDEMVVMGVSFSPDRETAQYYANEKSRGEVTNPQVVEAYISSVYAPDIMDLMDEYEAETGLEYQDAPEGALEKYAIAKGIRAVDAESAGEVGEIFVLDPTAIKAVDNTGSFDGENPDIRYSRVTQTQAVLDLAGSDPTWKGKMADKFEQFRMATQDRYTPLQKAQRKIERAFGSPIPDSMDVYKGEELMHGRIAERLDRLQDKLLRPLLDGMAQDKITIDEFESYLIARHARERNAQIAKINDQMPDGGSGMTNTAARAILARVARSDKAQAMEALAARVDEIRELTIDNQVQYGLISEERAAELRATYKFYVPLRGFKEMDAPSNPDRPNRSGGGINVKGPETKRAFGRRSEADSPLSYLIMQAEEAITRGETNRVAQELYELAKASPDANYWKVQKVQTKRRLNKETGLVEDYIVNQLTAEDAPYTVIAKVDGKEKRITMNKENPNAARLADAMRRLTDSQLDWFTKNIGMVNRWLSAVNTRFNPEFIFVNLFRDIQTAAINLQGIDVDGLALKSAAHYKGALAASMRGAFDKGEGDWGKWYDEFVLAGAKTAYARIDNIETIKSNIEKEFAAADVRAGNSKSILLKLKMRGKQGIDLIENLNDGAENSIRLAVYRAARESGLSEKQAGSLAKNITVNFNRRGQMGPAMNALYLFYNASVQGNVRIMQAVYHSKKVRGIVAGVMAAGLASELLNSMLSDDDDDGESFYDKIPAFEKERNIIIMHPDGKNYTKIPMPWGYNVFWEAGRIGAEIGRRGGDRAAESGLQLLTTVVGAFNPIGFSWEGRSAQEVLVSLIMPTAIDPIVDLSQNVDFSGKPIMPEESQFGPQEPDAQRYWPGVDKKYQAVTDFLTEATGGNVVEAGYIDVSPETMDYLANTILGAAGSFVDRMVDLPGKIINGDATVSDYPMMRKFIGNKSPYADKSVFFERMKEVEARVDDGKDYLEAEMPEEFARFVQDHKRVLTLETTAKEARKITRQIRKDRTGNDNALDKGLVGEAEHKKNDEYLDEIENKVITNFNRKWVSTVYKRGE